MAIVKTIYKRLLESYGPQLWWPAETEFEVMVGAVLTQHTSWTNVEKSITSLNKKKCPPYRSYHADARDRTFDANPPFGFSQG